MAYSRDRENHKCHVRIIPRPGENIDRVIKKFKRLCEKEGITKEFKRHESYESPGQRRRRKRMMSRRRIQKEENPRYTQEYEN